MPQKKNPELDDDTKKKSGIQEGGTATEDRDIDVDDEGAKERDVNREQDEEMDDDEGDFGDSSKKKY